MMIASKLLLCNLVFFLLKCEGGLVESIIVGIMQLEHGVYDVSLKLRLKIKFNDLFHSYRRLMQNYIVKRKGEIN